MDSPDGLLVNRDPFSTDLEEARRDLREFEIGKRSLASSQFSVAQKVAMHSERITQLDDEIKSVKSKSGLATRQDFRAALHAKREYLGQKKSLETLLVNTIGKKVKERQMAVWDAEITRRLAAIPAEASNVVWDPERVGELESEIKELKTSAEQTHSALSLGRRELWDLELEISQAAILDQGKIVCRTMSDLRSIADALATFAEGVEHRMENARIALEIFEKIEAEEKSRVVELFGSKRPVSAYFREMTDGQYEAVTFDLESNEITVRDDSGNLITADNLSGGAFDQLYLAIRLSMAEAIMGEEPGFLILDDPFVKSDYARLKHQMKVLKKVTRAGWQVMYFSAKKEVLDLLERDIAAESVQLIRMDDAVSEAPVRSTVRPAMPENLDLFPN